MKLTNFKTIALMLSASALLALSGCGSSGTPSDSRLVDTTPDTNTTPPIVTPPDTNTTPPDTNTTPPIDVSPTVLLHATGGGADKLGALYEINVADLTQRQLIHEIRGGQKLGLSNEWAGGIAYNPVDDKFYGIMNGGGFESVGPVLNFNPLGTLYRFDPKTDQIEYIANLPAKPAFGGRAPHVYGYAPLISPDGKSLLALAVDGGRESRPAVDDFGDGVLVHIDIDAASATFGKATPVLDLYTYSQATPLLNIISHPVWGKESDPAIFFLTKGEETGTTKDKGGWAIAKPTDPQDLSKPWTFSAADLDIEIKDTSVSRQPVWSDDEDAFVFARHDQLPSQTQIIATNNKTSNALPDADDDCTSFITGLSTLRGLHLTCQGSSILYPAILSWTDNWNNYTTERIFPEWTAEELVPLGMTESLYANKIIYNVTESFSTLSLREGKPYNTSRLEAIIPSDPYPRETLVQGNAEIGTIFMGKPAIGGALNEPVNDRWIVFYSYDGGKNGLGALIKYDRVTQNTTYVSLGNNAPTFPGGRPERISSDEVWIPMKFVADDPARSRSDEIPGLAKLDTATKSLDGIEQSGTAGGVPAWWTREFVKMPGSGDLWSVSPSSDGYATVVLKHDINTADTIQAESFIVEIKDGTNIEWQDRFPRFKPAAQGGKLWYLLPGPNPLNGEAINIGCSDEGAASNGDSRHWAQTFQPINGIVFSSVTSKFYVPSGDGRIFSFDEPAGTCKGIGTSLPVTEVVNGITDLSSTPMVVGSDGKIYFGTESGSLERFDPSTNTISTVADLASSTADSSEFAGFIEEVLPGEWMGIVVDYDSNDDSTARRLIHVDTASGNVQETDVSDILTGRENYPGVVLYQQ